MYTTVFKMTTETIIKATHLLNINSPNAIHKWICYQQQSSRADDNLLFRVKRQTGIIWLYIQSTSKFHIDETQIAEAGLEFYKQFNTDKIEENFFELNYFDVECFPCKCDTATQKRYFLTNPDDRLDWLKRQFEKNGINIIDCREYQLGNIWMDKYKKAKSIRTATFEGYMQIFDEELAKEFFKRGLGRFKAYGLGMIVASAR